jgi:hypothetical protein
VGLEDHFLIEFTDTHGFALSVSQKHAVEAAVGNGSGVEDGETSGAVAGGDDVADAIPGETGTQLGKFVGGVAATEQVEDSLKGNSTESAEGGGAAD